MLKKYAVMLCALLMLLSIALPASADSVVFTEDFSSGTYDKWTNPTIDNIAGIEDGDTKGVTTIKDGVMEIDNAATNGSFFYIGMKNVKMLNFTVTMKVRADLFNDGWLALSFRKDFNDRYNACNNNFIALRAQTDNKYVLQGYRGYAGSAVLLQNKVSGGYPAEEAGEWITWKIEVNGEKWYSYINDELMGEWYYTKNQNEGYISINACLFDGAVDDIVVTGDAAVVTPPTEETTEPTKETTKPTQGSDKPTEGTEAPTTAPTDVPVGPTETPDEPTDPTDETQSGTPDTGYIKSIYRDVTIDHTFASIMLEKALTVNDFNISFKLSDGYRLVLVDASGAEVTDATAKVTDTMKAVVYRGNELVKEYTLVINAEDEPEQTQKPDVNKDETPSNSFPTGVVVAIVVAVILVAGAVVVLLILKKKPTK